MTALAIDTSTQRAALAIFDEQTLIASSAIEFGYDHSKHILEHLQALFDEVKMPLQELQYVAVGVGPGSYTGIRVGVSCAKALSFALDIPLVGISSLRAFCPPEDFEGSFVSVIDAKIGGVYLLEGEMHNTKISYKTDERLVGFTDFIETLAKTNCLVTPYYAPIKQKLDDAQFVLEAAVIESHPSPLQLMHEAQTKFHQKAYSTDGTLELLYLRRPLDSNRS